MDLKKKIKTLYQKLKDDAISRGEYDEFLSYTQDDSVKNILDEILDDELKRVIFKQPSQQQNTSHQKSIRRLVVFGSIAASILVLIMLEILVSQPSEENVVYYSTTNGETREVLLPDSTEVILNANSSLAWIHSQEGTIREVKLQGEAFFEVYSMPLKPFRVYSNEMVIEVLGTAFNVNNREKEEEVFLEKGSVRISGQHSLRDTILLTAGEAAFFNSESAKVVKTTDSRFEDQAKWKDGILKFRNRKVQEILEEMQHIYGVQLKLNDAELLENPMDIALPYSNWDVVSKALALALGTELKEYKDHIEFIRK